MWPRARSFIFATAALAVAAPLYADEIPGEFPSVRPVGMGDANTAVANDDSSVWTNPAGIGRVRKARSRSTINLLKVPNIIVGANAQSQDFYKAYSGSADKSVENVLANQTNLGGKPLYLRAAAFPVTLFDTGRNSPMAFGAYTNTTITALVPKDTPDTAQVSAVSDQGAVLSLGWTNDSNRFNLGLQARPIMRYAYEDRIPSDDLVHKTSMQHHLKDGANRSEGLGVDFGMLFTLADFWYPTIGVAVLNLPTGCKSDYLNPYTEKRENVCGDVFKGNFANPDALSTVDPTDVRAGISITPRLSPKVALRFALDAHHIPVGTAAQSYGLQGIEASKLVHAGMELFFGNPLTVAPFALRAGYSQGFVTSGFSINAGMLALEFATYGVDVSSGSKPTEDRRYLGSLSLNL